MKMPTMNQLIKDRIIEKLYDTVFVATCQKCKGFWPLRFKRVPKECNICKCQNWWTKPGKKGRPKN